MPASSETEGGLKDRGMVWRKFYTHKMQMAFPEQLKSSWRIHPSSEGSGYD